MPNNFISRSRSFVEAARMAARSAALGKAACPSAPVLAPNSRKPVRMDVLMDALAIVYLPRLFLAVPFFERVATQMQSFTAMSGDLLRRRSGDNPPPPGARFGFNFSQVPP